MRQFEIYIDGASKGNPGHAGVGVIICQDGEVVKNIASYIGCATNNVAEYTALIYALEEALILKADKLHINTDSELLYRQVKKVYKVKHPNIKVLYQQVVHLLAGFKEVSFKHIPREQNSGADKLATKAIKETLKKQ
ncbi:MAG: ribonuclease HI family protein [Candidatus Omnitrophica bacterium]|jgi:ribonuclease HI|nr:ribonuclease HI family protein [Candidatus Omnitrophota bacterium]